MSNLNLTYSDFQIGRLIIATNKHTQQDLQYYIDKYEKEYLIDLLGIDLYYLFIADLVNGVPQTQIYIDIYNLDLVEMVKHFIYWSYIREYKIESSGTGQVENQNEVTNLVGLDSTKIYKVYNEAVRCYKVIQSYILTNSANYPTFKGIFKDYTSWI
jgi:hypothetical protein